MHFNKAKRTVLIRYPNFLPDRAERHYLQ